MFMFTLIFFATFFPSQEAKKPLAQDANSKDERGPRTIYLSIYDMSAQCNLLHSMHMYVYVHGAWTANERFLTRNLSDALPKALMRGLVALMPMTMTMMLMTMVVIMRRRRCEVSRSDGAGLEMLLPCKPPTNLRAHRVLEIREAAGSKSTQRLPSALLEFAALPCGRRSMEWADIRCAMMEWKSCRFLAAFRGLE